MRHILVGDVAVLLLGASVVAAFAVWAWDSSGHASTAVVRAGGQVVRTLALDRAESVSIKGPLGLTRIDIEPGRARVASDPSPRQLCVKRGWLTRSGQMALCLPNQVSLEIRGRLSTHDTLAY